MTPDALRYGSTVLFVDDVPRVLAVGSHACGQRMMPGAFARAVDAGADPLASPGDLPWGQTVAYVRSIEGAVIGLCSPLTGAVDSAESPA